MRRSKYSHRYPLNSRSTSKKVDIETLIKVGGISLTLVTLLIGIYQYKEGLDREFRKSFYSQQIEVYNELLDICSRISSYDVDSVNTVNFLQIENKLKEIYYGRLNIYQNEIVEIKTSDFVLALERFKRDDDSDEFIDNDVMRYLSFQIAQACRHSLANTFNIELNNLKFDTSKVDSLNNLSYE